MNNSEKEELFTEDRKMAQTSEMKDAKNNSDDNSRIDLLNIKPDNESYSKSNLTRSKTPEQLNLGSYVEKLIEEQEKLYHKKYAYERGQF